MIAVMLRAISDPSLLGRVWLNNYPYSESAIPWCVERHRNRKAMRALPLFKSMRSVLEVKSTNVGYIKEFRDSFSSQLSHKLRIVPVVAPWTSSRKSKAFLSPRAAERWTDFVRGTWMQSQGSSIPTERGRISISRTMFFSRRCSTGFLRVGAGLIIVTKNSTLY